MIARSTTAKGVSLVLSVGILAGAMQLAAPDVAPEMEGGGAPVEALIGSQFEDMAAGTLTALPAEDTPTPTALPETSAVEPTPTPAPAPAQPLETAEPVTQAPPATPAKPTALTPVAPAPLPDPVVPLAQEVPKPTPEPTPEPIAEPETIAAAEPDSDAPTLSKRPMPKNPERAAEVAQAQAKAAEAARQKAERAKPPAPQKATRGNAQRNNTKGSDAGTSQTAKATTTGQQSAAATQAGNAAASNYPGQVMRRISRLPKPRVNARGTTVVAFSIGSGGGLAGVSVARGSGSASLDRAAVTLIRRAAPFPNPPAGAQRQFSISIKGQ